MLLDVGVGVAGGRVRAGPVVRHAISAPVRRAHNLQCNQHNINQMHESAPVSNSGYDTVGEGERERR